MTTRIHRRSGLSLLELLAVVTLMGIFSATAFMRFGRDIFGDTGARSQARFMSLGLLQAQRAAIRTGDLHGLMTFGPSSEISSWQIVQKLTDGSVIVVDELHPIPDEVTVSVNANEMWFDFEGTGSAAFLVDLSGPNRQYQITVEPLTRMIQTQEVTP